EGVAPTMTLYHGHDFSRPFIYTGFAPWMFRQSQCVQLFDFVLQSLWGLNRSGGTAAGLRASAPSLRSHPTGPAGSARGIRSAWGSRGAAAPRGGLRGTTLPDPAPREKSR